MREQPHNLAGLAGSPPRSPERGAILDGLQLSSAQLRPVPAGSLCLRAPDVFEALAICYGGLLDKALKRHEPENGSPVGAELRDLGGRLWRLRAGARDVIELHARALNAKMASAPAPIAQLYVEEGRLLALELMGHLLSYYRTECLQAGGDGLAPLGANRGNGHG